jgi:hypothetical protein
LRGALDEKKGDYRMSKALLALACVATFAAFERPSAAGATRSETVIINNTTLSAQGSQSAAYHSSDANQSIGCGEAWTNSLVTPGIATTCQASDASGNTVSCTTFSTQMTAAVSTITTDSFIQFTWQVPAGGGSNVCTSITVTADSRDQPK